MLYNGSLTLRLSSLGKNEQLDTGKDMAGLQMGARLAQDTWWQDVCVVSEFAFR